MTTPRPQERFEQGHHPEGHDNPIQLDEKRLVYVETVRDPETGKKVERDIPLERLEHQQIVALDRYRQMRSAADTPEAQEAMKKWNRFTGNADPLSFGFWLKDDYLKGTSKPEQAEFAETISVFCEGDKMPRSMGMGYLDTQSELYYWFDEKVVWDYHGADFPFEGTWERPWPKDYPQYPELSFEQKKLWHPRIVQVPRDYDHPEVKDKKTQPEKDALIQKGFDFCKTQYVRITKFRLERGNAEDWMNKVEPNFMLFQKPDSTEENCFPNILHEMWLNTVVVEREYRGRGDPESSRKLQTLLEERKRIKQLMEAVEQRKPALARQQSGKAQPGDQEMLQALLLSLDGATAYEQKYWYKEEEVKTAPAGSIQTVPSKWREFHPVGEILFREWPRANLASLPGTRRGQGRLQFLIGMETMASGKSKGQVTPDSVKYGLLSHCYNLNEVFTDAIMGKVNPATHDLLEMESNLNRYRLAHGMYPVMIRPITVAASLKDRETLTAVVNKAITNNDFDWETLTFKRKPEPAPKKGEKTGDPMMDATGAQEPTEAEEKVIAPQAPSQDTDAQEREMRALDIMAAQSERIGQGFDALAKALQGKKGKKDLTPEEEGRKRAEKERRKSPLPGSGITQRRWDGLPKSEKKYLWMLYRDFRGMLRKVAEEKGYVDEANKERWDPSLNDLFED